MTHPRLTLGAVNMQAEDPTTLAGPIPFETPKAQLTLLSEGTPSNPEDAPRSREGPFRAGRRPTREFRAAATR